MSNPAAAARAPPCFNPPTEPPNQEKEKEKEGNKWWQPDTRWREEDGLYVDGLQVSELPDSFDDALKVK